MKIGEAINLIRENIAENKLAEAETLARQVLATSPDNRHGLRWLGHLALRAGRFEDARDLLQRAAKQTHDDVGLYSDLGFALEKLGDGETAIACYRASLRISPDSDAPVQHLAYLLIARGQLDEAASLFRRMVQLHPDSVDAHLDLASLQYRAARPARAAASFQRVLELEPSSLEAELGLSNSLLLAGDLPRGFAHFECRWRLPGREYPNVSSPRWDGSAAQGKSLLLIAEQGLGDTIQFARYLPRLAGMGMRIILAAPPVLHQLLRTARGRSAIVDSAAPLPPADFHLPLLSLPHVLHETLETIPRDVPYLHPERAPCEIFRPFLAENAKNIGIAWAGNPQHVNDANRSLPIALLAPLAEIPNVRWHGITPIPPPADSPIEIVSHVERLRDFASTAALLHQLDLVITVDTAAAHVAGALARPLWILLPRVPDWRWMIDRDDSPWYPTAKLFRQDRAGDWPAVVARIAERLRSGTP